MIGNIFSGIVITLVLLYILGTEAVFQLLY